MESLIKLPFCRTEQIWTQMKNTGLITDVLGPFADEPILTAVDKTLFYSCDLYCSLSGLDEAAELLQKAGCLNQNMSKPSQVCIVNIKQDKKRKNKLNISHSCSNLADLHKKNVKPSFLPPKKPNPPIISPCRKCEKTKERQWVETKTSCQGVKSYEVWSGDEDDSCPSIVFIVPPNGDVIPFESVPKCAR